MVPETVPAEMVFPMAPTEASAQAGTGVAAGPDWPGRALEQARHPVVPRERRPAARRVCPRVVAPRVRPEAARRVRQARRRVSA